MGRLLAGFALLISLGPVRAICQVEPQYPTPSTPSTQTPPAQNTPAQTNQSITPSSTSSTATMTLRTTTDGTQEMIDSTTTRPQQNRDDLNSPLPREMPEKPTEFQQMVRVTTGQKLPIFGASLFSQVPSTFAPIGDIPVTPDYVIGPGDQLRVQVWGQVNQQGSYFVDRTGSIAIPQVGTIHVAGLRFSEITSFLRAQLGRVYRNFDLNVNLGQLRSIQVFVVGQARRPGSYTIGSLSTLLNALFASGGPKPEGSLRDIQVRRGNEVITHFDMYDLLLHGDKTKDVMLQSGDVIFIPAVGPQVALVGSINNPGIYELNGATKIEQLLELGGGRTSVAAGSSVKLERIFEHTTRTILDVDLAKSQDVPLQNGDVITVTPIVDKFKDAVTLRGNVANPGRYVWRPGMRVGDLIPNKDALVTRNYWQKRNELGQVQPQYEPSPNEQMFERGLQQQTPNGNRYNQSSNQNVINRDGTPAAVNNGVPNTYTYDQNGNLQNTTIPNGNTTTQQSNDRNAQLNPLSDQRSTSMGGMLAGDNRLFPPKTDVVLSAPDIDWTYAVIERQSPVDLTTSLLSFNLGKVVLDGDQTQNLELLAGDVVTIFSTADLRVPTSQQTRFVRLEGEFNAAGVYSVKPGETLRQLLARAGGFTPDAYLYASEFTRESTRRMERQRLNQYADQLEAQVSAATSSAASRAVSDRDATAAAASAEEARSAIARLRRREPVGRIVLDLKPDSRNVDTIPDLALEDGDRFVVPRVPSSISVEGQVYSANAFVYQPHRRVKDYLRQAGGPDREADRKRSFLIRADGSVLSRQYGNLEKAQLFPGDTIVVPPALDRRSVLRTIVDISTIVGQLGFAAAAINVVR